MAMIKFFRNIRNNLFSEGKTGKYLKYAIGEIILVVIGILIALQINNWNDMRKNKNYEREILYLINENLKNDSIALSEQLSQSKEAIRLTDKLLDQISKENYGDSLNHWMGKIISFEIFRSQSSAFEILKSKGIGVISSKRLQLELISYYDENLHFTYDALEDVKGSFEEDWTPLLQKEFSDYKWREYAKPVDSKSFFEKQSTISLLKLYRENRASGSPYIEDALEKISSIRELSIKENTK